MDEERRIPHRLPGPLGTGVWPRQPVQPHLPKCPSTMRQSCEGSGARYILFAASELFSAARYWAGGEEPREHVARSGLSPAPGLLLLPRTQGCWRKPSRGWRARGTGRGGLAEVQQAPARPSQADRAGASCPQGLSDLGKLPLPPAGCLLAAVFPANPFTRHPRKVTGHYNPLGFNFPADETKLKQFSCFTLNYYDVFKTSASSACDFSRRKDEIKPSVSLVAVPHCPNAPPHHLCRCWVQQLLQDILRAWPDSGNNELGISWPCTSGEVRSASGSFPSPTIVSGSGSFPGGWWHLSHSCSSFSNQISIQRLLLPTSVSRSSSPSLPPALSKNNCN